MKRFVRMIGGFFSGGIASLSVSILYNNYKISFIYSLLLGILCVVVLGLFYDVIMDKMLKNIEEKRKSRKKERFVLKSVFKQAFFIYNKNHQRKLVCAFKGVAVLKCSHKKYFKV